MRKFDSRWSELGNGCESCHGAGSTHVEATERRDDAVAGTPATPTLAARALVNGLHTQAEQLDQCGVCHARRVRLREDPSRERMHDTWRPELLQDGLYFVDGQIKDEVFEIGSFLAKQDGGARGHLQPVSRSAHRQAARRGKRAVHAVPRPTDLRRPASTTSTRRAPRARAA